MNNMNSSVENRSNEGSKVLLDALESRYTCLSERPQTNKNNNNNDKRRYLVSLKVYGNREVEDDEPQSSLPSSFSKLLADQNIINPQIIKEKITTALLALCFRDSHVLVQFWSPVIVRKRCLLTTLDQPFGLGVVDEALYLYRLESEQRMFVVDGGHREELGPPGRVYRQKLPEWGLNAHTLPDSAACHNTHGYLNLPVFEPDSGCCVGVLELVTSSNYVDYAFEVQEVSRALKVVDEENLKCPNLYEDPTFYTQVGDERRQIELDEIFFALKAICNVHDIPLAQTWALSGYGSAVAISGNLEQTCSSFNGNCIGKVCMSTYGLPFYIRALSMWGFHEDCRERHLDKSQGVVGRSLSSCGLCLCEDVTKLGEDEYPLAAYAHLNGITSCLAIYVKSIERDAEYVIELVLPPHNTNEADLQGLMKTVKQQINNASSLKLGIVSSLQVIGGDHLNWNFESPPSPITILTEQEEVPPEPGKQPLLENDRDDDDDVRFSKDQSVIAYLEHIEDDILNSEPSDSAADGTSQSVVPCLDAGAEDSNINKGKMKRKRKRSEKSISLEEISKHYGKTINEAAKNLSATEILKNLRLRRHNEDNNSKVSVHHDFQIGFGKVKGQIATRSSVKLLGEIKDLLERNPNRERLFRRTVFGPWLDILSHDNDNHLMHYVLQHQFGRKEFCLVTGFRFGIVSEKHKKSSPFCERLFPEKITKKGVKRLKSIELLGVLRHKKTWLGLSDMDAVRVCLLIVAELVFMGKEDRNCIPKHIVSLVEDFDSWNDYPWGEYMWNFFYKRTVNVVAIHRADHLKKKKQNSNYHPTYNLYGFAWAFKIWILESYPNSRKWWSKKDNVLPRALAWSNVTKFEKNDYNRLFGPLYATPVEKQTGWFIASIKFIKGLVDEDFNVFQDDGVGVVSSVSVLSANSHEGLNETRVANNDMLLLEGGDGFFDSEGGATNPESNKDKHPTLANVLDEVRALRKEVALVKFDDARISKLERLLNDNFMFRNDISPNGNHNAINQGLSGWANHPMSTCSRPDIDNAEVAGHVIGIHKADGKNDSPNVNHNAVNKGLSCSANDPMSTCSSPDMDNGEVAVAGMGIHKADGQNDIPNANDNAVNQGICGSANDPMSTCSSPDMDNGEVAVAGMGIHKADGQNDILNANDNAVNQGIIGSANDPMLDVLIQVACDGMGIDKADGNNDYTYSQREPSTLDVLVQGFDSQKNHPGIDVIQHDTHVDCSVAKLNDHRTSDIGVKAVDEFADDFMDVLNDEESIPNYSLDDMKLQDEEEKLISTPAPVNQ
ncbi:NLP3-like protein [Tanacetum coccineum]